MAAVGENPTVYPKKAGRWNRNKEAEPVEESPCCAPTAQAPPSRKGGNCPSYIIQHYHSTGCCTGAFTWRAAQLNPDKSLRMCKEPREFRETTKDDIQLSRDDKRRGGGPRVGPFQETIPGNHWVALPKYDLTTNCRSTAFNERMHVEWENHVDHILHNDGELPTASVVAKAGFRSCAPCCRDMLALARPTGKTFIMVDLADDDERGTFHFVTGDKYLPIAKEACNPDEIQQLKTIVMDAQADRYATSDAIHEAVIQLGVPVDEMAQSFYLEDPALLPANCAKHVKGQKLLDVLHAEHFARLSAEYGASIMRGKDRPESEKEAVRKTREKGRALLLQAWSAVFPKDEYSKHKIQLEIYVAGATTPILPDDPEGYLKCRRSVGARRMGGGAVVPGSKDKRWSKKPKGPKTPKLTASALQGVDEDAETAASSTEEVAVGARVPMPVKAKDFDAASAAGASTHMEDDASSMASGFTEEQGWDENAFSDQELHLDECL